ncbi:hypothetical protein EOI86_05905 [Hwanghaeella grinnelliae]|uniref:DUF3313 domain-containing protein n=1 Tax=Hwanghaeella grinnelliae TaxID=2500179 RepID=A0A437QW88_9PROT|nr:hypothetical protein [Hwanghaeella grinnelliae]RVU38801.1 hypothetical protein EOI86_05905 [Hwanghaeella grinnelliae]
MKHFLGVLALGVLGAFLSGCTTHAVQTSSGADYLSQYETTAITDGTSGASTFDGMLREAAAVEPTLQFPAHIGLARLRDGKLTEIPEAEFKVWAELADKYRLLGRFSALDPLIADFTAHTLGLDSGYGVANTVKKVRLGAARQHMDAILVYEVDVEAKKENTALAFLDLTIIGGAVLPTRSMQVTGSAKALLIGVRNGYPYGTANAQTKFEKLSTSWGSDAYRYRISDEATQKIVIDLIPHVEDMFMELQPALAKVNTAQATEQTE